MGMKPIGESARESSSNAQIPTLFCLDEVETAVREQFNPYPICLTNHEGHKATFRLIDGKLMAKVRENLPDGFINAVYLEHRYGNLPLYRLMPDDIMLALRA